ncbi:hypothetical protein [Lepagella muris]|uniref:Uncharacterized protein n=1 Tax=Lepagella muris TaxID=3032870 RepID=A0AC61RIQ8_9BACT|nr:hypothetical protein [Lepagella muris]ROT06574.1 hypothetical protein EEL33_09725 [Muribaculaceae bacterium Isolate-037 (Harlan)]TGY81074.1 hypothetical protein E5331_01450 [Lepagella muris]THG54152.1 hypothetical protein E5984_01450 [Bacteroidales bacterium]TKC57906.1 hypothetical protein E5359_010785 [Bacteroidales bacterium]
MKTNSHIKGQSEAQSLRFNQIKKVAKVAAIIVGAIIGTLVWAMVRPVIRGAGWVISIITAIMIIFWLFTL